MSLPWYTKSTLLWSNYIMTAKIVYNKLPEKFFGVANMTWKKKKTYLKLFTSWRKNEWQRSEHITQFVYIVITHNFFCQRSEYVKSISALSHDLLLVVLTNFKSVVYKLIKLGQLTNTFSSQHTDPSF